MEVIGAARVHGFDGPGWVRIDGPAIEEAGRGDPPSPTLDLGDVLLAPGFVDLQVNGIGDVDFARTDADSYARAERVLGEHGVTTFLTTLISAPRRSYAEALRALGEAGAFGVHLEGPFLGGAPGAHRPEALVDVDVPWLRGLLDGPGGRLVRMVTLAPERDPDLALVRALTEAGVLASLGHSTCTYAEAVAAAGAGARAVTHLFNAMSPLHHREPGLAGAALDDDRLTPTLIADLVHVHPVALRLAASSKTNVALVSDAIAHEAQWARQRGVRVVDGAPRLADGTLTGSVLTLDVAVQNMVSIGVDVERAVEMASTIPARLIGLEDRGRIAVGTRADLVALDAGDLSVRAVWKGGDRLV